MLIVLIYLTTTGFLDIDSVFEEYALAFFISSRGTNSFRMFDGTR